MEIAILLDGDFVRRLLKRRLGHFPSVGEIEAFCVAVVADGETLHKTYYYDCPPYGGQKPLPVSQTIMDFGLSYVFQKAASFQQQMKANPFFQYRGGHLSFDGWALRESSIVDLLQTPRNLTDADFEPVLKQKQVDMKIGLDVAKLSIKQKVGRILLCTSDADFVPAIHFAKSNDVEVVLLSDVDAVRKTKGMLLKAFSSHRIV